MVEAGERPLGRDREQAAAGEHLLPGQFRKTEFITDERGQRPERGRQRSGVAPRREVALLLPERKEPPLGLAADHPLRADKKQGVGRQTLVRGFDERPGQPAVVAGSQGLQAGEHLRGAAAQFLDPVVGKAGRPHLGQHQQGARGRPVGLDQADDPVKVAVRFAQGDGKLHTGRGRKQGIGHSNSSRASRTRAPTVVWCKAPSSYQFSGAVSVRNPWSSGRSVASRSRPAARAANPRNSGSSASR